MQGIYIYIFQGILYIQTHKRVYMYLGIGMYIGISRYNQYNYNVTSEESSDMTLSLYWLYLEIPIYRHINVASDMT